MELALWIVLVLVGLLAAPMWVFMMYLWRGATPARPRPHDPRRFLWDYARRWGPAPKPLHEWLSGDRRERVDSAAGVVIAEVSMRRDGTSTHEAGGVHAELVLRLPGDGNSTTTVHDFVDNPENAAPGTYLPVRALDRRAPVDRRDAYELVANLPADDTLRLLTAHRQRLGLLTEEAARILTSGIYRKMRLVGMRPTGRVAAGHVEVVAVVKEPTAESEADATRRVQGFLRPVELVAARRSGKLPVTRSASGEYALGPTGY